MNAVIAAMANKLLLYKKKYVSSSPSPKRRERPVGKTIIRYLYNTFITIYYTPRDDPAETISTTRASVLYANIRFVKPILRYERVSASEKLQLFFTCEARQ